MENNSLTKFANTLYAEAMEEKSKVIKRLEKERDEVIAKRDAELDARFKSELKRQRLESEQQRRLVVSKREVELMDKLRKVRQSAADEVFDAVLKKLYDFTQGDEYREYIKREAEKVAAEFCSGVTVCACKKQDTQLIKELILIKNLEFEEADDYIIGGFTLKNRDIGIFADCTLRTRLQDTRELFPEISGLVID